MDITWAFFVPLMNGDGDTHGDAHGDKTLPDNRAELLAACTEPGRLTRAVKLASNVEFQVAEADLFIAVVAKYNVVIDMATRRIQHGCRDFQGQAAAYRLCKHVAATLLALDTEVGSRIVAELAAGAEAREQGALAAWRFEVITRFAPGR